jgi:hypothetical protein
MKIDKKLPHLLGVLDQIDQNAILLMGLFVLFVLGAHLTSSFGNSNGKKFRFCSFILGQAKFVEIKPRFFNSKNAIV